MQEIVLKKTTESTNSAEDSYVCRPYLLDPDNDRLLLQLEVYAPKPLLSMLFHRDELS